MKSHRSKRFIIALLSVFSFAFLILFYKSDSAFTKSFNSLMAPITVTKATPTLTNDVNGNGVVNPGDTLSYSITASNGATDATGVILTDVLNSNLSLAAGSVNSSPIAFDQSVSLNEDNPLNIVLTGADPDGNAIIFNSLTNPANGALSGTMPNLTYTPNTNFNGTDTFSFKTNDGSINSNETGIISITVNSVNDAPSFVKGANQTVNEDAPAQTVNNWATAISAGPANESTQTISFIVTDNTNPALFSAAPAVSSNDTLTYTPAANQNGVATITLKAKDSGGTTNGGTDESATQTFTITVNAVNDAPVAQAKSFNAQANMKIIGLTGLLAGVTDADTGINGCTPTFTVANLGPTTPTGGTITNLNSSTGTFDFDPPPGVIGNVTFTYTVSDTGCPGTATSAPATVTVNVAGPAIWFVNPAAVSNGDGRLSNPFNSLASATAAMGTNQNHRIFVYAGTTASGGGVVLTGAASPAAAQWLIGQGATGTSFDSLMGITPPAGTIARPSINGTKPTVQGTVTLGTNVTVKGLNISTGASTGMNDTPAAITGVSVSEVNMTTTTGTAVLLSDVGTGSNFNFTELTTTGGTGGNLTGNNTGATFTFSDVTVSSGANPAFTSTGGGTISICDKYPCNTGSAVVNTLTSTTGTALNVTNTTISSNKLVFQSISAGTAASGPTNGIVLNNTGSGGLTITGTGNAGTGGIIQKTSGAGLSFSNAANVVLDRIIIQNGLNDGVFASNLVNFSLANSTVNNNGDELNEHGIDFTNVTGTVRFNNDTFSNNEHEQIHYTNDAISASAADIEFNTIAASSTGLAAAPNGSHGINLTADNASSMDLRVLSSSFNNMFSNSIQTQNEGTGTLEVTITNSTFNNVGAGAINIAQNDSGAVRFNISNNPTFLRGTNNGVSQSININQAGGAPANAVLEGQISNNTIGNNSSPTSASTGGTGIRIFSVGSGTTNVVINNNNIQGVLEGIRVSMGEDTNPAHTINATIFSNTAIVTNNLNGFEGIAVQAGTLTGDQGTLRLDMHDNTASTNSGNSDFLVRQRMLTTVQLLNIGGNNQTAAQVQNYLDVTRNNNPSVANPNPWFITENTAGGGGGFDNTTNVPQPTLPTAARPEVIATQSVFGFETKSSLLNVFSQSTFEMLTRIKPVFENSVTSETIKDGKTLSVNSINQETVLNEQKAQGVINPEPANKSKQKVELDFLNQYNQKPLEFLNNTQTLDNQVAGKETISKQEFVATDTTVISEEIVKKDETTNQPNANQQYLLKTYFADASSFISEIADKLSSVISPTVIAQELTVKDSITNQTNALQAVETVCVDGNTDASNCAGGFSLPANKTTTVTFRAVVNSSSSAVSIPNTANVTAGGGINQNSNTVTTTVFQPITIAKAFNQASIISGGQSTVTLTLTNPTATNQTGASFSDTLTNMTAVGGAVTGTCIGTTPNTLAANASALSFTGITVPASSGCTVIFSVKSSTVGINPNTTSSVATTQAPTGGTPSNTANLTVNAPADLTIVKTHTGNFALGDTGKTYSITVTNSGGTATNGTITVTDTLPSGLTATGISGAGWSCAALPALSCTRTDALAAGSSYAAITLTVNVANNAPATVTNTATVSGGGETNTANNTVLDPTTVNAVTYSISGQVTNGGTALEGVTVALSGNSSATTVTNAAGNYSFSNLTGSVNYTVTPSLAGYTFTPVNTAVNNLAANQTNVNFATSAASYESDTAPKPTGGEGIQSNDVIQATRYLNELDIPAAPSGEFQRADAAPRVDQSNILIRGDGKIDASDVIQAVRYLNELDALTPAGGPSAPTPTPAQNEFELSGNVFGKQSSKDKSITSIESALSAPEAPAATVLRIENATGSSGNQVTVNLRVDPDGTESQISTALLFNTNQLTFSGFAVGNSTAATQSCNLTATAGRIRCSAGAFVGNRAGSNSDTIGEIQPTPNQILVKVIFTINAGVASGTIAPITFTDTSASNDLAQSSLPATQAGAVTVLAPTAATVSVSGHVTSLTGRGISGVNLSLTDSQGNRRTTVSKAGGYYEFTDVEVGETYVISATGKRFTFSQPVQIFNVNEDTNQIDFIANTEKRLKPF